MEKLFSYKGYQGSVKTFFGSNVYHGEILFINDLVTYESAILAELEKEFEKSVDDYLETCKQIGKSPDPPSMVIIK